MAKANRSTGVTADARKQRLESCATYIRFLHRMVLGNFPDGLGVADEDDREEILEQLEEIGSRIARAELEVVNQEAADADAAQFEAIRLERLQDHAHKAAAAARSDPGYIDFVRRALSCSRRGNKQLRAEVDELYRSDAAPPQ